MIDVVVLIEDRLASHLEPPVFAIAVPDEVFPNQTASLLRGRIEQICCEGAGLVTAQ